MNGQPLPSKTASRSRAPSACAAAILVLTLLGATAVALRPTGPRFASMPTAGDPHLKTVTLRLVKVT